MQGSRPVFKYISCESIGQCSTKSKIRNRGQGCDFYRVLNFFDEKWLTIYGNEKNHLQYWHLTNSRGNSH